MHKTNLSKLGKIVKVAKVIALVGVMLAGFAIVGQGDAEFQEMRAHQATHQPKAKHFYNY